MYAFIEKIEHVSFVEAVELLADRLGHTITYTGAARPRNVQRDRGSRSRLSRPTLPAADSMRRRWNPTRRHRPVEYLKERNFDAEAARRFGCGSAPSGWDC